LLAFAMAGCATPVVQPSVDVPDHFAQASPSADEPEVALWDSFGDPVLSDLVRRAARENRDIKIAAERVRAQHAPARRSAVRGCCQASGSAPPASITEPATGRHSSSCNWMLAQQQEKQVA
jgi:outer membrane protein TolC